MSMLSEFREFAVKGNAVDMAVGIVIGAAFGKIVTSLVNDIIMLPIGAVLGQAPFSDMALNVGGTTYFRYGAFLNTVFDFIIVAFCMFLVVRQMNRVKKVMLPPAEPTAKECPQCLSMIPLKAKRCAHCTSQVEQ
jgi:large conductance mechanosensitive channel